MTHEHMDQLHAAGECASSSSIKAEPSLTTRCHDRVARVSPGHVVDVTSTSTVKRISSHMRGENSCSFMKTTATSTTATLSVPGGTGPIECAPDNYEAMTHEPTTAAPNRPRRFTAQNSNNSQAPSSMWSCRRWSPSSRHARVALLLCCVLLMARATQARPSTQTQLDRTTAAMVEHDRRLLNKLRGVREAYMATSRQLADAFVAMVQEDQQAQPEVAGVRDRRHVNAGRRRGFVDDTSEISGGLHLNVRADLIETPAPPTAAGEIAPTFNTGAQQQRNLGALQKRHSTCNTDEVQCASSSGGRFVRCINMMLLCDGHMDCPHGEDEHRLQCMFYKATQSRMRQLKVMVDKAFEPMLTSVQEVWRQQLRTDQLLHAEL